MAEHDSGDTQSRLAKRYSEDAEAYLRLWAPVLHPHGLALLRELAMGHARRVLDLGTGVGSLLPDIQELAHAAFVVGIDRSEGMLALAPWNTNLAVMDGSRLAFGPDVFDVLVMAFVLQHFADPADTLWEARRVLRPGGRIGMATWGRDPGSPAIDAWQEELDALGAPEAEPLIANHDLMDDEDKVRGLLKDAGFWAIRTWTGRLDHEMDADAFLARRTGLGLAKRRFQGMEAAVRESCVAKVRERLSRLDPGTLVERDEIVFSTALKAR
jgi:ubiquinone/menaquinone biosynthesis C-methylase UbiE